jgi:murein DD-endopeptidase MepM/ murein hydrolase activator NlpD
MCAPRSALAVPRWAAVRLQRSLEKSVAHALPQEGPVLAAQVARLLRWRGSLRKNLHRDDQLTLLYNHMPPPAGGPSSEAHSELLALWYAGQQISLRAYKFVGQDGIGRYYTAAGDRVEPRLRNPPVPAYVQITELVQVRRRGQRRHHGLDLKAAQGAAVVLPFAGRIRRTNWHRRRNGRCIEVAFDDGRIGRFLHLERLHSQVRPGALLPAGAPLGAVGSTGHSNAPHLHYELWDHGIPTEPLRAPGHGQAKSRLSSEEHGHFLAQRDAYDRALGGPTLPAWLRSPP